MNDSTAPAPALTFRDLGLSEPVLRALEAVGYETPTPIQAATMPPLLAGRDLVGQAQTGTGKTAAFACPLLCRLDLKLAAPQALVLTPTRELAIQVAEAFQRYAAHMPGFHVLPIYGGQAYSVQLRALKRGVHVVVGTPGRVMDHLRRGTLKMDSVRMVVLDEGDEMLRMGFIEDVEWILEQVPTERQIALFSATMPDEIRRIARRHLRDPQELSVQTRAKPADTIRQRAWVLHHSHKLDALADLLEAEDYDAALIFVRTRIATNELASRLEARGISCAPLSGEMAQRDRERTVDRLRQGQLDVIVATDVAARGLDLERISHVVNFDMPPDVESYVHRIGRTGRAGRSGEAILFVTPREKHLLRSIERAVGRPIEPFVLPSADELNRQRVERFQARIAEALEDEDLGIYEEVVNEFLAKSGVDPRLAAAALARMAQGEEPLLLEARAPQPPPRPVWQAPPQAAREAAAARPRTQERERERERANETSERERAQGGAPEPASAPGRKTWIVPPPEPGMERWRVEIGRVHGVQPALLVAALANGAGVDGAAIGRIELYPDFSTVDLPAGAPPEVVLDLQRMRLRGRVLAGRRLDQDEIKRYSRKERPQRSW
jgi:ATP-dependent RNA helicase DeaD